MRHPTSLLCIVCIVLVPAAAFAQSAVVFPDSPMAGAVMWLKGPSCATDAAVVLDGFEGAAFERDLPQEFRGAPDRPERAWQVVLPPALPSKTYSVRWRCGTPEPGKAPPQVAVVDVRPPSPEVRSVTVTKSSGLSGVSTSGGDLQEAALGDRLTLTISDLGAWKRLSDANKSAELHVAFLALIVIALVVLGRTTNLLRDSNGAANQPYSLAKHQMAVWFVVVLGSYLYVWMITGSFASISTTALMLIGISGATGLVATTMDDGKREDEKTTRRLQQAEHDALEKTLDDPSTGLHAQLKSAAPGSAEAVQIMAAAVARRTRLQELQGILSQPVPPPEPSARWHLDLLSDERGISFHRLQMALWTVVLVMVYLRAVGDDVLMPEFDATLLGLMGISSGTYVGFKFPERVP